MLDDETRREIVNEVHNFLQDELTTEKIAEGLLKFIDKKKLIEYGEVLVESNDGKAIITAYDGDYKATEVVDSGEDAPGYGHDCENKKVIQALCAIANVVVHSLDWDNNKYADYRFLCGLEPNSDKAYDELDKVIDQETRSKLYDAGYEIIKTN